MDGLAAVADANPDQAAAMRAAWASWPGICVPLPSHHGHVTCDGLPPRFEMTWPVPRHGAQGLGAPGGAASGPAIGA